MRDRLVTANAYLGARPIAEALARGADLVITGRVADPSLTVGPCAHWFGWAWDDWDRLAGATVAGSLDRVRHAAHRRHRHRLAANAGRRRASAFRLPKSPRTGVASSRNRAAAEGGSARRRSRSNSLYEIGDPDAYLSPDATVSLLSLAVDDCGADRVSIRGARGRPAPPTYKVSATYQDGFRAQGELTVFGADAVAKARRAGEAVLTRLAASGVSLAGSGRRVSGRRGLPPAGHRPDPCGTAYGNRSPHRRGRRVARGRRAVFSRTDAAGHGRSAGHYRLCRRPPASPSALPLLAMSDRAGSRAAADRYASAELRTLLPILANDRRGSGMQGISQCRLPAGRTGRCS